MMSNLEFYIFYVNAKIIPYSRFDVRGSNPKKINHIIFEQPPK